MNIPTSRGDRIRVFVDRYPLPTLTDTDGALLVDTDGAALTSLPAYRDAIEITDRVRSGSVNLGDVSAVGSSRAGVDATVAVLTLVLDHGEPSLAPGAASSLNEPDELLRPYRPIRVLAEAPGEASITLFSGYLGDEIRSNATAGRASITLTARDLAKPLQDLFLSEFPILAGDATPEAPVPVDEVLQELLALVPAHARPPFRVADPVLLSVHEPYRPQNVSVWDAMQQLALQAGWFLGVIGDELVFLDPPRDKLTPDVTLDTDDAYSDDLGVSDTDVRNAVKVVFTDAATRERRTVEQRDQWSIDNLTGGIEKLSVLELDATSQIDTQAEAEALAGRFISDMGREFASTSLNLPFLPSLWLFSVIQMTHAKFTALPRVFAVHSIQHTFDQARRRTVVAGVGQVVGKRRTWLQQEPRPGSPNDPRGAHQSVLPAPMVTVAQGNPGMVVSVDQRRGVDAEWVQIYWSLVPGFIPGPSTLRAEGTQEKWVFASTDVSAVDHVIPGATHYVRVRSVDSQGTPGRFTQELSVTPAKVDSAAIVLDSDVEVRGDLTVFGGAGPNPNTGTLLFKQADVTRLAVGGVGGMFGAPPGFVGLAGDYGTGVWIAGQPWLQVVLDPNQMAAGTDLLNIGPFNAGDVLFTQAFIGAPVSFASLGLPDVPVGYASIAQGIMLSAFAWVRPAGAGIPDYTFAGVTVASSKASPQAAGPSGDFSWFRRGIPNPPTKGATQARLTGDVHVAFTKATVGKVDVRVHIKCDSSDLV